jgi:hypothetical protein
MTRITWCNHRDLSRFDSAFINGSSAIFPINCICTHLHVIKTMTVRSSSSPFCYLVTWRCHFYAKLFPLRCKVKLISCLIRKGNVWAVIVRLHALSTSALHVGYIASMNRPLCTLRIGDWVPTRIFLNVVENRKSLTIPDFKARFLYSPSRSMDIILNEISQLL